MNFVKKIKISNLIISLFTGLYFAFTTAPVIWESSTFIFLVIKFLIVSIVTYFGLPFLKKVKLNQEPLKATKKDYIKWAIIILIVLAVGLFLYYPECYNQSYDFKDHYRDATTHKYGDWHPVIYIWLFHTIPTLIIKSPSMPCICQALFVMVCLLYICGFLCRHGVSKKWVTFFLYATVLNPLFEMMSISPLKDVPYSYCLLLMTLFLIEIYLSNGQWLKKKSNFWLFTVVSFGIMFIRHNGIASFLAIMLSIVIFFKSIRKLTFSIAIGLLFLRFAFIPDLYQFLGIQKINITYSEITDNLSMQMIHIYHNGQMTEEQLEGLYSYYDKYEMDTYYTPDNYYSIKYSDTILDKAFFNINGNIKGFVKLWWSMVKNNPSLAWESYRYTTNHMWKISADYKDSSLRGFWYIFPSNDLDCPFLYSVKEILSYNKQVLCNLPLSIVFPTVGVGLFYILFSLVNVIKYSKRKLACLVPFVPVLSNFVLLMLVIPGKEIRFIYSNMICAFPLLAYLFIIMKQKEKK